MCSFDGTTVTPLVAAGGAGGASTGGSAGDVSSTITYPPTASVGGIETPYPANGHSGAGYSQNGGAGNGGTGGYCFAQGFLGCSITATYAIWGGFGGGGDGAISGTYGVGGGGGGWCGGNGGARGQYGFPGTNYVNSSASGYVASSATWVGVNNYITDGYVTVTGA